MLSNKKIEALKNFTEHRQRLFLSNDLKKMGPRIEGTPDFIWRGWSKDFFEFEIFDSGIIFIRKILFHVGIFWRIQNNLKLSFCIKLVMKQKMFLGVSSVVSEEAFIDIRHGIFSGRS